MKRARKKIQNLDNNKIQKTFIGIDNGVSGGITILSSIGDIILHKKIPVKKCLNYTKKKAFINRVDLSGLKEIIEEAGPNTYCMIERPMVNPTRFVATISAVRCLEATEIVLEELQVPYEFIDSRIWQKKLLPDGLKGNDFKIAADSVASRLYPKQKIVNSDCLLIAVYCKRKILGR